MSILNNGLIYTNEQCIGCNKCISGCPVLGANVVVKKDGEDTYVIKVDGDKCIHCGHCLEECKHDARQYLDDTADFFHDLQKGEKISLLVAPAFLTNYPKEYSKVLGYLKSLGVNHIYSVSFGADITTWAYLNYISKNQMTGEISQPCPAIVNYIEHYKPELLTKLIPVHSPLLCAAIYVKKYLKNKDKLAFISPCIAKKDEISDPNTGGMVSYNVTFSHLMKHILGVNISGYDAVDELEYGLGSIYPMPGGLKENVENFLGVDKLVRQIEGEKVVYPYFDAYYERVNEKKELPILVDALNCSMGCNYGTATEVKQTKSDDVLFEIQKLRAGNAKGSPFDRNLAPEKRMELINKKFSKLNLQDFIRVYNNKKVSEQELTESDMNTIFDSLYKHTEEEKTRDCGSCGYASCKDMVRAIAYGYNITDNCVYYAKEETNREKNEIQGLLNQISDDEKKQELFNRISSNFEVLNDTITQLGAGNEEAAGRTKKIAEYLETLSVFGEKLSASLESVNGFINNYESSNEQVAKISNQTNLIALNAGIEAARSGEAGRAFTVIAERVRQLADQTKHVMQESMDSSKEFIPTILDISEKAKEFIESVKELNKQTQEIAASTEEISSQTEIIMENAEEIKKHMEELIK